MSLPSSAFCRACLCLLIALNLTDLSLQAARLRVAFVGDPQVDNATELEYARRSIFKELRERKDLDLVIILGDLVNDKTELLAACKASLDSLPCPWICTPGNHDKDFYKTATSTYPGKTLPRRPRDLTTFLSVTGYTDTSFVCRGVRFVSMDNVRTRNVAEYDGGLRGSQKRWLDSIVRATPRKQLLVLCTHIPVSRSKGLDSLSCILGLHPNTLLVSGHLHSVLRHRFQYIPDPTACTGAMPMDFEELIAGAACGSWWRGSKDRHGIPQAWMGSGDPRGYFIADFACGKCKSLNYKMVGEDIRLSLTRRDTTMFLNVYGGRKEARVCIRSTKWFSPWVEMTPSRRVSTEVEQVVEYNASLDRAYKKAHREEIIPLRRYPCDHLWELPCGRIPAGPVRIRYDDGLCRFQLKLEN